MAIGSVAHIRESGFDRGYCRRRRVAATWLDLPGQLRLVRRVPPRRYEVASVAATACFAAKCGDEANTLELLDCYRVRLMNKRRWAELCNATIKMWPLLDAIFRDQVKVVAGWRR